MQGNDMTAVRIEPGYNNIGEQILTASAVHIQLNCDDTRTIHARNVRQFLDDNLP